jgi:hypothetical protein
MAMLAIVERAYRGAVEKQFFDSLYLAAELDRQLGGLELLLRGPAVSCAVRTGEVAPLRLGGRLVTTLSDPRSGVVRMLAAGVPVWVDADDLTRLGFTDPRRLVPGARPVAGEELARRWCRYRMVFFL